jgi:hypothetical protein
VGSPSTLLSLLQRCFSVLCCTLWLYGFHSWFLLFSLCAQIRALLYIVTTLSQEDEDQKKGMVILYYSSKKLQDKRRVAYDPIMVRPDFGVLKAATDILRWMPVRLGAFHLCLPDNPAAHIFNPIVVMALDRGTRIRIRMHDGTVQECMASVVGGQICAGCVFG